MKIKLTGTIAQRSRLPFRQPVELMGRIIERFTRF
jgi:hypothetical protein